MHTSLPPTHCRAASGRPSSVGLQSTSCPSWCCRHPVTGSSVGHQRPALPRAHATHPHRHTPAPTPSTATPSTLTHAASSRRSLLLGGLFLAGTVGTGLASPSRSQASLVRFPADQLNNRYYLVRAGESYSESFGEPLTNPVWKTSERHGLSELGKDQVLLGLLPELTRLGACTDGCWLWPSITQNSYQTAEVLAYTLGIGRSRIVPEYSFLDARGVGALENVRLERARAVVAEGDLLDAAWRPQPGTDGTPHESSTDVLVRMRQVMSITETQYFGEDVLLIAPDSDPLSVLQCAVLGIDLRQHRRYAFRAGEVRPLLLSAVPFDGAPISFSCPDPPKCTRAGNP